MEALTLKDKFELKELELNALLEVTQAINNNLPEDSLYRIYSFILRASLNIRKMALFVYDEDWSFKSGFGTTFNFKNIMLEEAIYKSTSITHTSEVVGKHSPFFEFDFIIPVSHKDQVLALVCIGGLAGNTGNAEVEIDTNFIEVLSNIIVVAIENKKLARRELRQEAYRKELEIAKHVQQLLFPKKLPKEPEIEVEASYLPHHTVGGDYYDYFSLDETKILLCIADVSGKGVPAAILMSNFQASLRTLTRKTTDLHEVVTELNYQVMQNANLENFITFFVAIYDKENRRMTYVNAGHNPPLLTDGSSSVIPLDKGCTILGMFNPLPFLEVGEIENLDRFLFFAYTDGLTETFNEVEEPFGLERLTSFVQNSMFTSLADLHVALLREIDDFRGERDYSDDITLLSCKVVMKN